MSTRSDAGRGARRLFSHKLTPDRSASPGAVATPDASCPPERRPFVPALPSSSVRIGMADRRGAQARATATATEAARPKPHGFNRRVGRLIADVFRKSERDRLLGLAAENAFAALLCVFPMLIVVAAVLGQLSVVIGEQNAQEVERQTLDFLADVLTSSTSPAFDTAKALFDTTGRALTLALVLGLASVAQAFASFINTVTLTYDVHDTRGWWYRRWLGLVLGIGSILIAVVVVTLVVVGPLFAASDVAESLRIGDQYAFVFSYLRWPIALVALILWATTMYHLAPARAGPWRRAIPGALLAAVLWLSASIGFNIYLELTRDSSPVFSALGGGLIIITWLYLLCFGLLVGAELNAVLLARSVVLRQTESAIPTAAHLTKRFASRFRRPLRKRDKSQQPDTSNRT